MPLWLSVPTLDLDDDDSTTNESHLRFAYAVILSRDPTQPIRTLCLKCAARSFPDIKVWVNTAIQRSVEAIELSLSPDISLPSGILNCKTLVALKLKGLTVDLDGVSSLSLPALKILHLYMVRFSKCRFLEKLLSCCRVLEDLEIKSLNLRHDYSPVVARFKEKPIEKNCGTLDLL